MAPRSGSEADDSLGGRHPEAEALLEVELDRVRVVARVADRQVLTGIEEKIAAAEAEDRTALHRGRPDDRPAEYLAEALEQRVSAVLGGLEDAGVRLGPEGEPVGPLDADATQRVDRPRDMGRVAIAILAEGDCVVGRGDDDPPWRRLPSVEDGGVLALAIRTAAASSSPRSMSGAPRSSSSWSGRPRTSPGARPGSAPPRRARDPSEGASGSPSERPRLEAEKSEPWGPLKSTSRVPREPGAGVSRASSSSKPPARSADRRLRRRRWLIGGPPRRLPITQRLGPRKGRPLRGRLSGGLGLRLPARATIPPEEDPAGDLAPEWSAAGGGTRGPIEKCFILSLGVPHDRERLRVGLHRKPLLIPTDRFGLLGHRRAEPGERPGLLRQLLGRLVILVESHGGAPFRRSAECLVLHIPMKGDLLYEGHRIEYDYLRGRRAAAGPRPWPADEPSHVRGARARRWPAREPGLCVDLLGHGRSDRPEDLRLYSMPLFARQVAAAPRPPGAPTAVVGGTSLGANVALELAVSEPERAAPCSSRCRSSTTRCRRSSRPSRPLLLGLRLGRPAFELVSGSPRRSPAAIHLIDLGLDLVRQRPGPSGAVLEGLLLGETAPHREERRRIEQPTLIVGHPARSGSSLQRRRDAGRGAAACTAAGSDLDPRVAVDTGTADRRAGIVPRRGLGSGREPDGRGLDVVAGQVPAARRDQLVGRLRAPGAGLVGLDRRRLLEHRLGDLPEALDRRRSW